MKKNDELKQSKISRHEIAKEKFRFFERSMSCKSLNNKTDFIPAPGQFAIVSNVSKKKQSKTNELPSLYGSQNKQEKTQKSIKFTTNLKLITRQKSPSRVSQLLNQTVNRKIDQHRSLKKITKSESTGDLRPFTALSTHLMNDLEGKSNLKDSKIISNAAEHDKKYYMKKQFNQSNTFMVKSRMNIPKHAYGYKSIRLTPQELENRLKLQSETKNDQNKKLIKIQRDADEGQKDNFFSTQAQPNFLPIEYYIIDDQKPEDLIEKYKIKENYMVGFSKWQNLQGDFQWKKCRIIDYIKDKQRWQIEWFHNGKRKIVARNNLFFEKENFQNFQKIINDAQNFRKHSEVYMKYNWLIDNMKNQTHTLEDYQLNKIIKLVHGNSTITFKSQKPIENLLKQIKQNYIRANHIVQFNASLPFNVKHKNQFLGYLPDTYFIPNSSMSKFDVKKKRPLKSEQKIKEDSEMKYQNNIQTKVIPSHELKKLFETSSRKFIKTTSLSSINRIHIIQYLNKSQLQIHNKKIGCQFDLNFQLEHNNTVPQNTLKFYSFSPNKKYDLNDIIVRIDNCLFQSISKLNNIVCEVEYFVAKELDPIYSQKKSIATDYFDDLITGYRKFLSSVNMRIENMGRSLLFGMLRELEFLLKVNKNLITATDSQELYDLLEEEKKSYKSLNVIIKLEIKGQNIEATPKKQTITQTIKNYIQKLIEDFSQVSCIRKSYIQQLRPKNKMKIIENLQKSEQLNEIEWKVHKELVNIMKNAQNAVDMCHDAYERLYQQIKKVYDRIWNLQADIKKKTTKKCNFTDIQEFQLTIKDLSQNITKLKMLTINSNMNFKPHHKNQTQKQSKKELSPEEEMAKKLKVEAPVEVEAKFIKLGMFSFNIDDCISKFESKLYEISYELYKLVLEKVVKENERMDKQIDMIMSILQKQPLNIKQMISLQQYINEQAAQELMKISGKISQLQQKFSLLQKLNIQIQYKDYYQCHKIYMKPIRIRAAINGKLKDIEVQYRKKFGDELVKEIGELGQEIREVQDKFYQSVFIKSIDEMDSAFIMFSKLKERIEAAIRKSEQVNEYESAMKWINTNFTRINEIKDEFLPYYQLISLEKNYRFHIESQLTESLHTIDASHITQDVLSGCDELARLAVSIFYNNPTILDIVKKVSHSYTIFRDKLPLIQILRNTDLRQRHWNSIKELTGYTDILTDKITFQQLQLRDIKRFEKKLIEISHIATRELIYEKKLNKMKKQWKQLKIHIKKLIDIPPSQNPQPLHELKVISNLIQIQTKTQNDIYQIQQILSSSFIKFLEKDILNWRNFTLYKMYEFVQIWKTIERDIVQMYKMFSKAVMKDQASAEYQKFKILQKNWKNITCQIEQQPNILELLQTKINESLKYTVELIEDLKKLVSSFFEKKKQRFSRFGALSQDELIALYSNSNDEKEVFDQAVRKCLHGVKNVIRDEGKVITCIKTHLDEEIQINHGTESLKGEALTPDRVIEDIEKRIKKSLQTSIDSIEDLRERNGKILQIVLFHQRIIFTRQIENQLIEYSQRSNNPGSIPPERGIKEGYLDALLNFKQKIIEALFFEYSKHYLDTEKGKRKQNLIKIQTELNQLLNHIEIAQQLYRKNVQNVFDFEWVSQIRTYQKSSNYFVGVGLNNLEYGFQITDQQQYVVEKNNARLFCHISMAIREKMFGLLTGNTGTGKLSLLHYLANVHGKNQLILNCHKALSHQNAFDFIRMCANGIWIVFNHINLLSREVFSCFRQSLQLFWANYPTQKSKTYFMLGDKHITFSTHQIGLFGTINTSNNTKIECGLISQRLSNYFRSFSIPKMDDQYILECKLLFAGFEGLNTGRFLRMIELVEQECENFYQTMSDEGFDVYASLSFSKLNFIQKVVAFSVELKQMNKNNIEVQDFMILEQGLAKGIEELTRNLGTLKSSITSHLATQFCFLLNGQQKPCPPKNTSQQLTKQPVYAQKLAEQHDEQTRRYIKKLFTEHKLYCSDQLINHYFDILKTLKHKHSVIVLGNCSTGKSLMIKMLTDNKVSKEGKFGDEIFMNQEDRQVYVDGFRISLKYVHPNAYSLKELFGDNQKNGIANCLIKDGYETLEKQISLFKQTHPVQSNTSPNTRATIPTNQSSLPFQHMGIVFDSEIGAWIEPLLPLIKSSSNYVQPNGKNVIVEYPLKLIFECRDLSSVSPSIILSTNIVHFEDSGIKWQNVFGNYVSKNFKPSFSKKFFVEYCQQLVTFIMEPILQFFKSSMASRQSNKLSASHGGQLHSLSSKTELHREDQFIEAIYKSFLKNQVNYIPLIFNQFIALVEGYYKNRKQEQEYKPSNKHIKKEDHNTELFTQNELDDRDKSAIFNLFLMAVTWSIGLFVSEESKKTFSRHFKYLIKRAVQLNLKGIDKNSLPQDEEDIYEICFIDDKWHLWQNVPKILSDKNIEDSPSQFSDFNIEDSIPLKTKIKYLYMLEKYCDAGLPFYIVGKSSSGKNSLMLEFIRTRSTQIYNKILLACTPQTNHQSGKLELKKQIQKEKYSHALKGFVHRKMTLFYMCDVNLPLMKNDPSLDEFLHEYLKRQGWYLSQTSDFYKFKNIVFCGTLNSSVRFSQNLLKYINPLPYVESQEDIKSKLYSIFEENEYIAPYCENFVRLMTNLHEVVGRELRSKLLLSNFNYRDMCSIAQSLSFKVSQHMFRKMSLQNIGSGKGLEEKSTKRRILQCWIIETERKYREKFGSEYDPEKIFYFINNVLMEEERTRYRSVLPSESVFVTNLDYYLGKLRISEFKSMKRGYKSTKIFYTSTAYKIYKDLQTINEDIEALEKTFETTKEINEEEEDQSLAKDIHSAVQSQNNVHAFNAYLRALTAMLDYLIEDNSHLVFFIDDRKDSTPVHTASGQDHLQMDSTLKRLFTFTPDKPRKSSKKPTSQMDKLLKYVSKINNSKILHYQRDENLNDSLLQWKIFITQLFELINSPTSSLHDHYLVHLKNLHPSQFFILEDLLGLKRTGTLSMLEDYINSEEVELDDGTDNSAIASKDQRKPTHVVGGEYANRNSQDQSDEEDAQTKREKVIEERKIKKKNTAQIVRDKILAKVKFIITIDHSQLNLFKLNYSILLEKCHILWLSHLSPSPPSDQQSKQNQKQNTSLNIAQAKDLTPIDISIQAEQLKSNKQLKHKYLDQDDSRVNNDYDYHKQSFNNDLITWNEVRDVYLAAHGQVWSKDQITRAYMEINLCENLPFLSFIKLYNNLKIGISKKVHTQLQLIEQELAYFNSLSAQLIPHLGKLVQEKKSLLLERQSQLNRVSHEIKKLEEDKEKFMSYFVKSQESMSLLERESREANELYHQYVGPEERNFMKVQFALVDLLKSAKDRKVVMTNEMKIYIEMFGQIISKKLKPDQSMHKQIVKDMAALKVHKKVANLLIEFPLGEKPGEKTVIVGEKAMLKLKQFISKNLQAEYGKRLETKQDFDLKETVIREMPFSQGLLIMLKEYFMYTMAYFSKTQEEKIKALNKKCLKCVKELAKTKDEYHKSVSSKQYETIALKLNKLQKQRVSLLNHYEAENQLYQQLIALQKKSFELLCLNHCGEVDQKQIARRNLIDNQLLTQVSPIDNHNPHILVEKIKNQYIKQKDNLSTINLAKDLIALLIASKITVATLTSTIDPALIVKIINKQAFQTIKTIKAQTWQNCFTSPQTKQHQNSNSKHDRFAKLQRSDIFDYLLKEFNCFKALQLIRGLVFIEKNEPTQNWFGKKTNRSLRYEPSLAEKLATAIRDHNQNNNTLSEEQNIILESNKFSELTQTKKSQNNNNISVFSNPLIIVNLTSLHDAQMFISSLIQQKQLQEHLIDNSFVVIYEKIPTESLQNAINKNKKSKHVMDGCFINVLSLNQNSNDEVQFIRYIEHKIEDELCQQKKQSDIKALNRLRELRQSQKQNFTDRKIIIRHQSIAQFLQIKSLDLMSLEHDQTSRSNAITTIQKDKIVNQPQFPSQSQQYLHIHTQQLNQLSNHFADLKQNLLEYAAINQAMDSLPNMMSSKKKSNIQTAKLIKYIARLYQGLKILQQQNLIIQTISCERFAESILWIVKREKQAQKGPNTQVKMFKQIKNKIFQYYLICFNHRKLFLGLVFALSGHDSLSQIQFGRLLKLIIRLYTYSIKITQIDSKIHAFLSNHQICLQNERQKQKMVFRNQNEHLINNFILKPLNSKKQKQQISATFEEALDLISETFSCFGDLKHNMKRKMNVWIQFLKNIEDKFGQHIVHTLPQPYNDINKVFFGVFVALSNPEKLQKWIDVHLLEQDLTKLNDSQLLSNESRLLQISKLSYKQTVLIGDNALSLLFSLCLRTKKQLKLYSKVQSQVQRRSSTDMSHKNSPVETRKEIPLNQMSYFANRKLEKEFVQEMYQCMKNSQWLVIDCDNLISTSASINEQSQIYKLQAVIRLIDLYTNRSKTDQNQEEDYTETHLNLSESSQQNFSMKKINKTQLNFSSFDTCDYKIFFVISSQNIKFIQSSSLLNNHRRSLMEITPENDVERCFEMTRQFHQELIISKKFVKEYQNLDFSIKFIAFYGLKALQQALSGIVKAKVLNQTQLMSLSCGKMVDFVQIRQLMDKMSKILLSILQEPQYLMELLNTNKLVKIKSTVEQDQQKPENETQSRVHAEKEGKHRNQVKTNSRFQKQRNQAKKKTLKLIIKSQAIQEDERGEAYSNQKSLSRINLTGRQQLGRKKEQSKNRYLQVTELLKLFNSYLSGTLTLTNSVTTGFNSAWKHYSQEYFTHMTVKVVNQDNQNDYVKKLQSVLMGDPNKAYTSNKSILQDLITFINSTSKDQPKPKSKQYQSLNFKNAFVKNQLFNFSLLQYRFQDIRLFLQRLLDMYKHVINEHNFTAQIQSIAQIKKKCQAQATQLKRQLLPPQQNPPQTQNTSGNQFNFSSLTQNLTIDQMRKKLARKSHDLPNSNHTQTKMNNTAVSRLKEYCWKIKQEQVHNLDKKLILLKSLKPVFLLERINYHCMWEMWKKSDKQETLLNLVQTLLSLSNQQLQEMNHKRLTDTIEYMKNQQNLSITSLFSHALDQPVPMIDLQSFKKQNQLQQLIKLLKDVFMEVNGLKDIAIRHQFMLEYTENQCKKTIQHKIRSTNMYKICEFEGFGIFGCKLIDEKITLRDKNRVVLSMNNDDDHQAVVWGTGGQKKLKLVMYFEQVEDEDNSQGSFLEQEEEVKAEQVSLQNAKTKQKEQFITEKCRINFFLNKVTLSKNSQTQRGYDHMDKVQVNVVRRNKFVNRDNMNSYIYY